MIENQPEYKSGYPIVARLCKPCGVVKAYPSRNKFCSPECAAAARSLPVESVADLLEPTGGFAVDARAPRVKHPTGWEPHVEENGDTAVAVSQPTDNASADEDELIRGWKLDPTVWRIEGPLNCRRWQMMVPVDGVRDSAIGDEATRERHTRKWWVNTSGGDCRCEPANFNDHYEERWLYYYKANLVKRHPDKGLGVDDLTSSVASYNPSGWKLPSGDLGFVVCIADPQIGKPDGDGVEGTTQRFLTMIDSVLSRIEDLRATGQKLETLYVFGMGDLIENCDGYYAQQTFVVDLNRRDQIKLMRRLIVKALEAWSPFFDKVVVAAVAGNHGENRKNGKSFTDFADNDDVAIFEQVQEILAMNPAFNHVTFLLPNAELSLTLDIYGTIFGLTHGHAAGNMSSTSDALPQGKIIRWWKNQAHGMQPIGDAQVLVTAHYHHFSMIQSGMKTHIQCPAMEGGSDWFRNMTGAASPPGTLSFLAGRAAHPTGRGWSSPEVH